MPTVVARLNLPGLAAYNNYSGALPLLRVVCLRCCSEAWLHACLNLLHWKLRELDPEGLATVATSLVKLGVIISNGKASLLSLGLKVHCSPLAG
jgi:hypothetical protein